MLQRARQASPPYLIFESKDMCPMLILHGDHDALVPREIRARFYDRIVEAGLEDKADFYTLKNAGHGTKEFFQPETKALIRTFFDRNLIVDAR